MLQRCVCLIVVLMCALLATGAFAVEPVAAAAIETRVDLSFPEVDGLQVLVGDFHIHTVNSDGSVTSSKRVLEAYRYGFDVIAITDHGKTRAYRSARSMADALGIVLIQGFETGLAKNEHLVVLGISEDHQPRDAHRWAETPDASEAYYRDELKTISDTGAVVIYAHPHCGFREPIEWGIAEGIIQGIEVKNDVVASGWNTVASHGTHCYSFAFDWALENNLAVFANSDIHGPRNQASYPATLVFAQERSADSVMDAIRACRTVAWFNGMLWGPEKLLGSLMDACVTVRQASVSAEENYLAIRNRAPLSLKAVIQGQELPAIDLPARSEVLVKWNASNDSVQLRWENVWITPDKNLVTQHDFTQTQ